MVGLCHLPAHIHSSPFCRGSDPEPRVHTTHMQLHHPHRCSRLVHCIGDDSPFGLHAARLRDNSTASLRSSGHGGVDRLSLTSFMAVTSVMLIQRAVGFRRSCPNAPWSRPKSKMSLKHLHQLRPTGEGWGCWLVHEHCRPRTEFLHAVEADL